MRVLCVVCREFAYVCVVRVHQRFKISEWKCIKTKVKRENTHTYTHEHAYACQPVHVHVCVSVCICSKCVDKVVTDFVADLRLNESNASFISMNSFNGNP